MVAGGIEIRITESLSYTTGKVVIQPGKCKVRQSFICYFFCMAGAGNGYILFELAIRICSQVIVEQQVSIREYSFYGGDDILLLPYTFICLLYYLLHISRRYGYN